MYNFSFFKGKFSGYIINLFYTEGFRTGLTVKMLSVRLYLFKTLFRISIPLFPTGFSRKKGLEIRKISKEMESTRWDYAAKKAAVKHRLTAGELLAAKRIKAAAKKAPEKRILDRKPAKKAKKKTARKK